MIIHADRTTDSQAGKECPLISTVPASSLPDRIARLARLSVPERARVMSGLAQAGIDAEGTRWLERELANPATIEELSDPVTTPEKAAQVYAAARVAIEPDTMQEREFLRQLAEALDLDPDLKRHLDDAASGIKAGA